jgi:hypothetical protein
MKPMIGNNCTEEAMITMLVYSIVSLIIIRVHKIVVQRDPISSSHALKPKQDTSPSPGIKRVTLLQEANPSSQSNSIP